MIMKQTNRTAALWAGAVAVIAIAGAGATLSLLAAPARAAPAAAAEHTDPQLIGWAFLGAALSTGLAALAAGYAVARVGSAAVGAVAEKPELFGRALVLVGLAEGIAIYGLIVSILILNRIT
jgi:V/A-type H+-transporting ATPase subunit K